MGKLVHLRPIYISPSPPIFPNRDWIKRQALRHYIGEIKILGFNDAS
ncbi:MAG TPA: hypothetical protein VE971_05915 [Candidatus Eisenbacteria bacterium]|nr:hypothetical protein [Candidatus Eisenbacteria bacterium]